MNNGKEVLGDFFEWVSVNRNDLDNPVYHESSFHC
jgi:hypothetical protein